MKNILCWIVAMLCMATICTAQDQMIIEYSFRVEGECGMCKDRIEETAIKKGGAETAVYDLDTKTLTVSIDENRIAVSEVRWELAQAGHDNGSFMAPDEVYDGLPECCQHRPGDGKGHSETGEALPTSTSQIQDFISGYIYTLEDKNKVPLIGAHVVLEGHVQGTTTDENGYFEFNEVGEDENEIVITYIGFPDKTAIIDKRGEVEITLDNATQLDVVEIVYKKRTTEVSFVNSLNIESISREELCKAACCNLSESFETNPSIDVSFPDAITGTKTIQMLGLAGPYVKIDREFIPNVRGINSIYGLGFVPGPWIQNIHLIKGAGSVVNGFESITGQINVELKKPDKGERLFVNPYYNSGGTSELNINARHELSDNLATGILFHNKYMPHAHDQNEDGYTDMPIKNDFLFVNRWKYGGETGLVGQAGVKVSLMNHEGGYHDHFSGESVDHENHWQMFNDTKRYEVWSLSGYIFENNPQRSVGLQLSATKHEQDAEFGFSRYDAEQKTLTANLIYQDIISEKHSVRTGLSFLSDDIFEFVSRSNAYTRKENVPGAFFEYTYSLPSKFTIIPGIRVDNHSNYGFFVTPRLHMRYNLAEKSVLKFVVGRGLRTASIFSENIGLFSSSRLIDVRGEDANNPYGLDAEEAWNMGVSFLHAVKINDKELLLSADVYRTTFENQIIADFETAGRVSFYNLDGSSFSNSFQVKLEYELFERFNVRSAYRIFDVQVDYDSGRKQKPMVSRERAFLNMAYVTKKDIHFDFTLNWKGKQRLPDTSANPLEYQRRSHSPSYFLGNCQISKHWGDKIHIYMGGENIFNFKQRDAIIAGEDPFGEHFDASIVWAPLFGANWYMGVRYNLAY